MSWKSYIFPQTILITSSPYNHHIRINEECGRMKLLVNTSPQSGKYIEWLWQKTLDHFHVFHSFDSRNLRSSNSGNRMINALILGLGGGTLLTMLARRLPGIKLTCVDIDPTIIALAKQYFHVDTIPNLIIIESDAETFVKKEVSRKHTYDLVVIDLSFGRDIPPFVTEKSFLTQIYSVITPTGTLLINYLREKEYRKKSDDLFPVLQNIFPSISDFEIANNRFFYCLLRHSREGGNP